MENHHEGTISLCMIVRDEEDTLGRCLESARGFVDEIVIVDTGSRDDTPAIAARYGARILHLPWRDDFSQARNESLKQAIGEWVLVLDADEELPPETAGSLRGLTCCSEAEAWTFTIISPCSSDRAGQRIKHPGLRMFKNRDAYFFEGRLHEQIRPSILRANPDAAIMHANAEIIHNGYSMGIELRKSKTLRNISILEQALAEKPDDPFPNYNLGLSYYALGELEKSSRYYEAARRLIDPRDGFAAALFRNYSICLEDLGNYEQALDLTDEGLAYFPDYPDLYFIKGQLYCDLNMTEQAKANFLKCLRFKQTLPEYVTNEGVTGHLALNNLAEVCTRENNFEEAAAYLEQVLKIRPVYELFAQLCSLLQQKGLDGSGVAAYLEDGFGLDHPTIARLSFGMKQERILRLVLEALLAGDCDPSLAATQAGYAPVEARQVLENYALRVGLSREALRDVKSALCSGMATAGVYYLLGKACAGLGRPDEAFIHFARAGMQEPGNELYAACALEQLASQCLQHLVRMLKLDDGNSELRKELFRVTSVKRKAQLLQQDLLRRACGEDFAVTRKSMEDTEAAGRCGGNPAAPENWVNSAAAPENRRNSEAASADGTATEPAVPEIRTESKPEMQTELLSIVMPVWAGAEVTNKALQAIVACTDTPYEIIIIDNGSDSQCQAAIAAFVSQRPEIARVIRNDSNRGYPIACNQGLGVSRGRYAVVMNNDVLVTPHWASLMMAAFSGDPPTGIVGPRTNYVSGVQLVGECHYDETTLNEWSQQWHSRHAGSRQSTLRLVGFLMMIRRELIEQIGGFDPIFGLGNFDDDDYCLRARLAGYQLVIAEDVFVHHYGSMSFNKQPEAFARLLEKNKQLFFAKWGLQAGYEGLFSSALSNTGTGHARLYIPLC